MNKLISFFLVLVFAFSLIGVPNLQASDSRTWSGTIYDIRTGKPLA